MKEPKYEPIFETEKGSMYLLDKDSGKWLRKKYDGEIITNEILLGSIDNFDDLDSLYFS